MKVLPTPTSLFAMMTSPLRSRALARKRRDLDFAHKLRVRELVDRWSLG
jgi:hypothetical protein